MRETLNGPLGFREIVTENICRIQHRIFARMLKGINGYRPIPLDCVGQAANDRIRTLLESKAPCLIARFGGIEFAAAIRGYDIARSESKFVKLLNLLTGCCGPFWWDNSLRTLLRMNTGLFPVDDETLMRFSARVLEDSRQMDVIGTWNNREMQLKRVYFPSCMSVSLGDLTPFLFKHPWTMALAGRKVLLVHPFDTTIRSQYERRNEIWADPEMLPDFELKTYRPVVSFLGLKTPYRDWFEALDKMCSDIATIDFDVAIIGCGAYGMSIGAYIKRELHRQAVHFGGATQLLFGIKGGRWDGREDINCFYNESWVRPSTDERPSHSDRIENGCYW